MHGLERAINDLADPMVVMRRVVDQALLLVPDAEGAVVELASEGMLTYVCTGGSLSPHYGTRLQLDGSLSGLAIRLNRILLSDDTETDDRVDRDACRRVGARSMVCVPLRRGERAIGALKVTASEPHAFGDRDIVALGRLAEFISVAVSAIVDIADASREVLAGGGVHGSDSAQAFIAEVLRAGTADEVASRERIQTVLALGAFTVVAQPILDLDQGRLVGVEALSRFTAEPARSPDLWFAEAAQVGLGPELELAAVAQAVAHLPDLPEPMFASVNLSPEVVLAPEVQELIGGAGAERIVLELTEHVSIEDYPRLRNALDELRGAGTRIAVDDSGTGFSGLAHIYNLAPDIIKLDRQITAGLDEDPIRRALARALATFADDTDAILLAEGIETHSQLEAARELGVRWGQGYLFGRPGPQHWRDPAAAQLDAA